MTSEYLADAIDRLYAVPSGAFTRERDNLVRSLKAVDKQAAARVKVLRRPPVSAWALNQVARSHPADLAALGEADAALTRSQRSGEGRESLAEAGRRRRQIIGRLLSEAVSVLVAAGHPDSPATRDRMAQTLAAIAVDEAGRAALVRGRLTQDLTPASLWEAPVPSGGAATPPAAQPDAATATEADPDVRHWAELTAEAEECQTRATALDATAGALERQADQADASAREAATAAAQARQAATAARAAAREAALEAEQARQALRHGLPG